MVRNIKSQYIALDKQNKIALGDAIGCLKELADNSVDFIITDPPYNLGLFMKKRGTNMDKLRNGHFAASGWDDLNFEDWTKEMDKLFSECHRVLKEKGNLIMFMSIIKVETIIGLAEKHKFYYKTVGVWHKTNPLPRNMNLHFINSTETWIYLVNDGTTGTFNNHGKAIHDFVETATIGTKERKYGKHPTQKPIGLLNHFIEILSNDRTGLLSDIVREITAQKINIMGVNTKTSRERIATIEITIEVENIEQLNKVIKAIRKVDSVYEVNRKK